MTYKAVTSQSSCFEVWSIALQFGPILSQMGQAQTELCQVVSGVGYNIGKNMSH